jgi:biopolymer transport protein ExbD
MAFQPSKSKRHDTNVRGELNMNSMMDMMTIILLFLLKSFSTSGALVTQSETLALPQSARTQKPVKELNVMIAKDMILVNELPIIRMSDVQKDQILIGPLAAKLSEYAQKEKQLEIEVGKEFKREVIIQGDKTTGFDILFKVMYTCARSEFNNMRLLTVGGATPKITD